jgi:hypothetical protein
VKRVKRDVTVHFFKPSGKWYTTEEVPWTGKTSDSIIHDEFAKSLHAHLWRIEKGDYRLSGMTAVCIDPEPHQNAHPLMLAVDDVAQMVREKVTAMHVKAGAVVHGRASGRKGRVVGIEPAGFRVLWDGEREPIMMHPLLHLVDDEGREFDGPWWRS